MSTGVLVLVEGESDAAVLRILASARGLDGVPLLSTGGAMGTARALRGLVDRPRVVLALCDEREAPHVGRALTGPSDALFVCHADLEDVHALGTDRAVDVLAETGDLRAFRTLQNQPQHRGRSVDRQLHRFIGAGSGRKARIDAAFAASLRRGQEPPPLAALLDRLVGEPSVP